MVTGNGYSLLTSLHNWTKNWNKFPLDEVRRSTRIALKLAIAAQAVSEPLKCDGKTIVVKRHGTLNWTSVPLLQGWKFTVFAKKGGAQ
jgi:hypothetical protein